MQLCTSRWFWLCFIYSLWINALRVHFFVFFTSTWTFEITDTDTSRSTTHSVVHFTYIPINAAILSFKPQMCIGWIYRMLSLAMQYSWKISLTRYSWGLYKTSQPMKRSYPVLIGHLHFSPQRKVTTSARPTPWGTCASSSCASTSVWASLEIGLQEQLKCWSSWQANSLSFQKVSNVHFESFASQKTF